MKQVIFFIFVLISFSYCSINLKQFEKFWNLTRISYCDAEHINKWECGSACDTTRMNAVQTIFDPKNNLQSYIGYREENINGIIEKNLYMVFKGTDIKSKINIMLDLEAIQVEYKNQEKCKSKCKVHKGFQKCFYAIRDLTYQVLDEFSKKYQTKRVIILGHSLGGSIAAIAAVDFMETQQAKSPENQLELVLVTTLGAPRVGNAQFSTYFNSLIPKNRRYRLTNDRDFVVHLPQEKLGFTHANDEIHLYEENNQIQYKLCEQTEDPNCSYNKKPELSWDDHTHYFRLFKDDVQVLCKLNETNSDIYLDETTFIQYKLEQLRI